MKVEPQKHHRRSIRIKGYDYTQPGAYFITMVTYQREDLFGEIVEGEMRLNWTGNLVKREWKRLPHRFPNVELDEFVVMPNHVHGLILIIDPGRGTAGANEDDDQTIPRCAPTNQNDDQTISCCRAPINQNEDLTISRHTPTETTNQDEDLTISSCAPTRRAPINHEQFGKPVFGSIPTISGRSNPPFPYV